MKKIITIILLAGTTIFYAQEKDTIEQYKYGFIDIKTGKEITPLKYDEVDSFEDGAGVVKLDGKYGFINREGKEITAVKYDQVTYSVDRLVKVRLQQKWGIIDREGKEIIPVKYDKVASCIDGLIKVKLHKKYGIINREGEEIVPIKYDSIRIYKDVIVVGDNNKYGVFDLNGVKISRIVYDQIQSIGRISDSLSLYEVRLKDKFGLVNDKFGKITDIKYDEIFNMSGIIKIKVNDKYGFLNLKGEEITDIKYKEIGNRVNIGKISITPAMLDNKWSFFNDEGKEAFTVQYDAYEDLGIFSDSYKMMKVSNDVKWGCVNENLIEVIPPKYDEVDFHQLKEGINIIKVRLNNKWGVLDTMGNELVAAECDEVKVKYDGFIYFKINGKWGANSETGKEILTAKYQEIKALGYNDLFTVKINDKWGVSKGTDRIVIPALYDEELFYSDSTIRGIVNGETILFNKKGKLISKTQKEGNNDLLVHYCKVNYPSESKEKREVFTSDFIKVKKNDNWIFVDNYGQEMIIPIKKNDSYYYRQGIATVKVKIN
ncbi:WG repeat-containing protein [Flavobacterium sp. SORGH_AS_0622]|uniref:WG repeat-containing protein n=1 Tax=Flavobacterium sp. SORGH_AS_0622 TaxID=3041772 RepID=UPI00277F3350|nr:WG repeat-containing protein [Flavobacterium sp. SORGH_AS_0622]MDQ1165143.1 hypothetical protein [Flavobacterium sp. SORGH_AS_0622]